MMRATWSTEPPAGNTAITLTGFVGQFCARACGAAPAPSSNASAVSAIRIVFIGHSVRGAGHGPAGKIPDRSARHGKDNTRRAGIALRGSAPSFGLDAECDEEAR